MQIGTLTESLEDYLEIIFRLLQSGKVARVRDIAREKDVKTSSVVSALQRLAKEGLVDYQVREYVDLTEAGSNLAFNLNQRHEFLKRFLVDLLQVDEETAEHDACSMEHSMSLTTLDKVAAFAEYISYCPSVDQDLIPSFRDCWLSQDKTGHDCSSGGTCDSWITHSNRDSLFGVKRLDETSEGDSGYVARIIASEKARKELIKNGLLPAVAVTVLKNDSESVQLLLSGQKLTVKPETAGHIYLWVESGLNGHNGPADSDDRVLSVANLSPGDNFKVVKLAAKGEIRQRLIDMGFVRGAEGSILREALLKDPIEIKLRGYLLSLRRAEARDIIIEKVVG